MVRITMRRIAIPVLLALLLGGLLTTAAEAKERVKGPGYRTHAPTGWVTDKQSGGGWRTVTITPPGHVMNMRDSTLISISVASVRTVEKATGLRIRDKDAMVQKLISIPKDATLVQQTFAPRPTTLRHQRGVQFGVSYDYKGTGSTHTATLVRRGKRIFLLQVIQDANLSQLATSAANMVTNDWRWK
jgi:hypothetical protein